MISQKLFDDCQAARAERARHHQSTVKYRPYLLRGLVYCHRCCQNVPADANNPEFGKMRGHSQHEGSHLYYRCRARNLGYTCPQGGVVTEVIDEQVVNIVMNLRPPENWQQRITQAMSEILGEQSLEKRLKKIHAAIERIDFRWDNGFIPDKMDYLEKRIQLQQELERLTPIPEDDLQRAADILQNFGTYWDNCKADPEAEHRLIRLIIERIYVEDDRVVALTLKSNYHIVLGHKMNGSTGMSVGPYLYTSGSDGHRLLVGCWLWVPKDKLYHLVLHQKFPHLCAA